MSFSKIWIHSLLILNFLFIAGCSDLFQKEVKEKVLESEKLKANCELDIDRFSLIMEENIESTIDCLGKNIKLFMSVAETKKKGYLSRTAFENYLKRNRKDIKPELIKALKAVFEINYLVYGEDSEHISEVNVDALINLAKIFNEKTSLNFNPVFADKSQVEYDNYRVQRDQRIKPAALVISNALKEIFNDKKETRSLDIMMLLEAFTNESNQSSMDTVKSLLFVKKVLLGGDRFKITSNELGVLIENFSSYVLIALDGIKYKNIRMDQESLIHFLNSDLELLNSLIFSTKLDRRDHEVLFTLEQLIDAVEILLPDSKLDLRSYNDLLKEGKVAVMGGHSDRVTGIDLKNLFRHGLELLKTGSFFHLFWASERAIVESRPGRNLEAYKFEDLYKDYKGEKKRVDDFVRIIKKYRFQRGENLTAYYTDDYYRNANAVYEIAIYEYVLTLAMKHFGCPNNTLNGRVICDAKGTLNDVYLKTDHVIDIVQKFKKVLISNDLVLPGREVKTAETITLLGSLFQYQSDENKVFDVNEATEFAISLFTSIDVSNDLEIFFKKLNSEGKCDIDTYGRVAPDCFKKHFFQGVCLNYPDQFPKLYQALGAKVYQNRKLICDVPQIEWNTQYLKTAVKAARTCNVYPDTQEEIYYSKGDVMSVFLAMMHIETTILRWDTRTVNNKMDPKEVMDAYAIYSPALDGFLEKMPSLVKKLKKQIYQYLVKYEKIPEVDDFGSILKFVKFLITDKAASADRKTIASILVAIGEQGAPSLFDCNLLHDPTNIPEDYDPTLEVATRAVEAIGPSVHKNDVLFQQINAEQDGEVRQFLISQGIDI